MLEPGSTTMPLSESFVFRCCCSFSIEEEEEKEKEFLKPPDEHRAAEGTIRWYEVDVVAPSISLVVRHILRKEEESARRIFTCKVKCGDYCRVFSSVKVSDTKKCDRSTNNNQFGAKSENSIDENSPSAVIFVRAAERVNALYLKII